MESKPSGKKNIAIACQGGGSHTAFTAGGLKHLFERGIQNDYNILGISGTSGGSICALLSWYGLYRAQKKGDKTPVSERLVNFWLENATSSIFEEVFNQSIIQSLNLQSEGITPQFNVSPYDPLIEMMTQQLLNFSPRRNFVDFQGLLEKYVDFDELRMDERALREFHPRLLLGAVNVLTEEFKAFDSHAEEIAVEAVLASAAIPTLFKAVEYKGGAYWDGLFSQNPPIRTLLEDKDSHDKPDEIWVIRINPPTRREPRTINEILDSRNQLSGNLSLLQEVGFIKSVNSLILKGLIKSEAKYKPVGFRWIGMGNKLQASLGANSKMDRDRAFIEKLMEDGEKQAQIFCANLDMVPEYE